MGKVSMGKGWGAKPRPLRPKDEVSGFITRAKKTATTKAGPLVGRRSGRTGNSRRGSEVRAPLSARLLQLGRKGPLCRGEERHLIALCRSGDAWARRELVERHLLLVVSIARGYAGRGLPVEDLVQEGAVGLIRAVDRFDPTDGNRLSTYAVWWIRQSIGRAIANHARSVRVPVHVWERFVELGRAETQLCVETGRDPTEEELARRLGWDVRRVRYTVAVRPDASSLDAPSGGAAQERETALGDLIADEVDVEAVALRVMLAEQLREALAELTELQRRVLELRYGLDGNRPATLAEAADVVGFSGEWVRLVQRRAENDLRRALGVPANGKTPPAAHGSRIATGMPLVKRGGGRECSVEPPVANLG